MLHVVLVDNRRLRILEVTPDGALVETYAMTDPEALERERDLRSDRPGRVVNVAAGSRVAYEPKHAARSISLQRWLKSIGLKLAATLADGHSDGIVLIASSRLLGILRVSLPKEVRRKVLIEVARDLAKQTPTTLVKRLQPTLQEAAVRLQQRPAMLQPEHFRPGD